MAIAYEDSAAPKSGDAVISTIATVSGIVANAVAPGTGAIVSQVVQVGGEIFQSVANAFRREKKMGATDAQAAAAAAKVEPTAEEKAALAELLRLEGAYAKYLANLTAEDTKLSTIFKGAKMTMGGNFDHMAIAQKAMANGEIDGTKLGVYKGFYTGNLADNVTTSGKPQPPASGAMAGAPPFASVTSQRPGENTTSTKKPQGGGLMNLLAVGLSFFGMYWHYSIAPAMQRADSARENRQKAAARARKMRMAATPKTKTLRRTRRKKPQ